MKKNSIGIYLGIISIFMILCEIAGRLGVPFGYGIFSFILLLLGLIIIEMPEK